MPDNVHRLTTAAFRKLIKNDVVDFRARPTMPCCFHEVSMRDACVLRMCWEGAPEFGHPGVISGPDEGGCHAWTSSPHPVTSSLQERAIAHACCLSTCDPCAGLALGRQVHCIQTHRAGVGVGAPPARIRGFWLRHVSPVCMHWGPGPLESDCDMPSREPVTLSRPLGMLVGNRAAVLGLPAAGQIEPEREHGRL